jgi:hypothetical protein
MLIEEKPLRHWIDNFYGYGSWDAAIWFVGYEEGGGDLPEEVAEKINYFQTTHPESHAPLCDIREQYRHLGVYWDGPKAGMYANRFEYRFGQNAAQNTVWKNLIAFEHGYLRLNLPDILAYQKQHFLSASSSAKEALINLYPLPSPHNHGWYYSWLDLPEMPFLKSREKYEQHVYQTRIGRILSNIRTHKPQLVLMYGMSNINALKKSIQQEFAGATFRMIKKTKLQIPQHHRADLDGTILLITTQIPALRHNRVETGFDWEEFGKTVRLEK